MQKCNKKTKYFLAIAILLLVILFVVCIWQTIKIKKIDKQLDAVDSDSAKIEAQLQQQEKEIEYFESEEFKKEYSKYELEYIKNNEKIYK